MKRKTKETRVQVSVTLDGQGRATLDLEDRWLRHMLEALCKFSGMNLSVRARGDFLHHINEDVAITLGREFRRAIDRRQVRRLGTATVAMDDALVLVSVDLVDRPFFDAKLPDEMLEHFLRSFTMESRITLHNVVLKGKNYHHINEATFKALGLAIREATASSGGRLMSTKGKVRWDS
jgi:imidazoleglycerol-phosphate dehydratase